MFLGFPTLVTGSVERPELLVPVQIELSCTGFLTVINCIATGGCVAVHQLTGVQGKLDALLLPAEKLLWAVGMG